MRLVAIRDVRIVVRVVVVCVFLSACWSAPRPCGPAALLRRQHRAGDVLRIHHRFDASYAISNAGPLALTITLTGLDDVRAEPGATLAFTEEAIHDEHILAAGRSDYEVRRDRVAYASRMHHVRADALLPPIEERGDVTEPVIGAVRRINSRNRATGIEMREASRSTSDTFQLSFDLDLMRLVGFEYPERTLRKHDRFTWSQHDRIEREDRLPNELAIAAEIEVRAVDNRRIALGVRGTQSLGVRGEKESIRSVVDFDCAAKISRGDGRSGIWTCDTRTTVTYKRQDSGFALVTARAHHVMTIDSACVGSACADTPTEPTVVELVPYGDRLDETAITGSR